MITTFKDTISRIESNLTRIIHGKSETIRLTLVGLLSGGHILLEDVPGTGKTTLAKSLARTIDGQFRRIQFTPDLLPADILGGNIYNPKEGTFHFREGPVFANIVLADEINRASPRTQSAMLEVMSENQVSTEGITRELPKPFLVIATQNPIEFHGTYPLPEAQLDRFALRLSLGYPELDEEVDVLFSQHEHHPYEDLCPVVSCEEVLALQASIRKVMVKRNVAEYIVRLTAETRKDSRLRLGVSPRGSLTLYRTAQARAFLEERDFVQIEDVQAMALPVLAHRMILDTKTRYEGLLAEQIVLEHLKTIEVPR